MKKGFIAAAGLSFLAVGWESDGEDDMEKGPGCGRGERSWGAQSIYYSPISTGRFQYINHQ